MTTPSKRRFDTVEDTHPSDPTPFTFPVTVRAVIGNVEVGEPGEGVPPHVAAMQLVAEHDTEGEYEFPMRDGRMCRVTVEWVEPGVR